MRLISFGLFALFLSVPSVNAQKAFTLAPPNSKQKTKPEAPSVDPLLAQKRLAALSLLISLADEARSYRDESLRARVQARVADALWDEDRARATELFRRAWAAAEVAEATPKQTGVSGLGPINKNSPPQRRTNLRTEILRLAARRDRVLAEEFLSKLTATTDKTATADQRAASAMEISERLRLAGELLQSNNVQRAMEIVDPVIWRQVSDRSIRFLISLREKNPTAADKWFNTMVSLTRVDASADANTVSLLTSYAFTPSVFLVVSNTGIPSVISGEQKPPPNLTAELRQSYFRTSAQILLRPFAQLDQTSAGRAGTYVMAKRLLPLFQQYASDLAGPIAAQMSALAPSAPLQNFEAERALDRGIVPDAPADSRAADELQGRLDRARNTDERDRAYAFAAMRAADSGDSRARDYVDKIEDLETRKNIASFVDFNLIEGLLRKKNIDEALRITRRSNLAHVQLTRIFTQAAGMVMDTDRGRARELLEDSLKEALRTEAGSTERAYALVALVAQFARSDRVRSWELLGELVKAANALADFTGENGTTLLELEGKFSIRLGILLATPEDLPTALRTLAQDDFYQAINVARTFQREAPRALVTLAIARAALEVKSK